MRHFIVLGFTSNSKADPGKEVYLGTDRAEALAVVNTPDGRYIRKEMYPLAVPEVRRHAPPPAVEAEAEAVVDSEAVVDDEAVVDSEDVVDAEADARAKPKKGGRK